MHSAPGMILKTGNIYCQFDMNLAITFSTILTREVKCSYAGYLYKSKRIWKIIALHRHIVLPKLCSPDRQSRADA